MKLRPLKVKDAALMLEWMHDKDLVKHLNTNFMNKTLRDCLVFIEQSSFAKSNLHLAVVDEYDTYMGTVSLKHIDLNRKSAEFAIAIRRTAQGKGYAFYAMNSIIEKAHKDYILNYIYWCVSRENVRAIRFYNKHGFLICNSLPHDVQNNNDSNNQLKNLVWYSDLFSENKNSGGPV